jgi:hypothetical protein
MSDGVAFKNRPGTRVCKGCGERLDLESFPVDGHGCRSYKCKQCWYARQRELRKLKPEVYRQHDKNRKNTKERKEKDRDKRFGLMPGQFDRMMLEQGGRCAICREPEKIFDIRTGVSRSLAIDHDHASGAVRGLLCHSCNISLGHFGDDAERLWAAIEYLLRSKHEDSD